MIVKLLKNETDSSSGSGTDTKPKKELIVLHIFDH